MDLSDRSIYGILAVALLSHANLGQVLEVGHYLIYKSISGGTSIPIDNTCWWGRAEDFSVLLARRQSDDLLVVLPTHLREDLLLGTGRCTALFRNRAAVSIEFR